MITTTMTVTGPTRLEGKISISGAKNAALPIMIASLVSDKEIFLKNIPDISDVENTIKIFNSLNISVLHDKRNESVKIDARSIKYISLKRELVSKKRSSIWLLAPLLIRIGKVDMSYPGGCKLGIRKIDLHIKVLEMMGASIEITSSSISAKCSKRLKGINFSFDKISVGATITAIVAACFAKGDSVFTGCAIEPEVQDICIFLKNMGCKIKGVGTSTISIEGIEVKNTQGIKYSIIPDRIEIGTYIAAVGIAKGRLVLENTPSFIVEPLLPFFLSAGITIRNIDTNSIEVVSDGLIKSVDINTDPYPAFATDLQPIFTALMCFANGNSRIVENIYVDRMKHVQELAKMNAKFDIKSKQEIVVVGNNRGMLKASANLFASDLRCGASLIISCLSANGTNVIHNSQVISRGYGNIVYKLNSCGAKIYENIIKEEAEKNDKECISIQNYEQDMSDEKLFTAIT